MVKSKNKNLKSQETIARTRIKSLLEQIKEISSGKASVTEPTNYIQIPNAVDIKNGIGFLSADQMQRLTPAFSPDYINLILSKDSKNNTAAIVTIIPEAISYRNQIAHKLLNIHYGKDIKRKLLDDEIIEYLSHQISMMKGAFCAIPKEITYLGSNPLKHSEIGLIDIIHPRLIQATLGTENSPYAGLQVEINTNKENLHQLEKSLNEFEFSPFKLHQYKEELKEYKDAI